MSAAERCGPSFWLRAESSVRRGEGREGGREGSEGGVSARTAEILKSFSELLMILERLWEGERREGMELRRLEETRGKEGGEGGREGGKKGEINCVSTLSCYVAVQRALRGTEGGKEEREG